MKNDKKFRFEDLIIWKEAIRIGHQCYDIGEQIEKEKKYRWAEQLYGSALSISNNIAEGAGSISNKEFARYLIIARKSIFEVANILFVTEERGIVESPRTEALREDLAILSKRIYSFRKSLLKNQY